ncbi:MAG: cell wall metabolism sensor histidine kinase WalK [Clostridiales bacterium]|jgi:two-component system sensor histidine kinase VicK|nr:cell wall metabolism sensor histidine kinase WalK [Clostridiales bacterium]
MFRSLYLKLVLIMTLLMISIMAVVGTFLISNVAVYHLDEFSDQMVSMFQNEEFVSRLRIAVADGADGLSKVLDAYSGNLGIDPNNRNYYILDAKSGMRLAGSDEDNEVLDLTPNILAAINGEIGDSRSITASYIDIAIPITSNINSEPEFIIYIRDLKQRQEELTTQLFTIILEALVFGLVISILLSFLLSKTMTTPIESLTHLASDIARGEFSKRIEVHSGDEIGVLTETFNDMAEKLQTTLETVENERNKLNTLFLRMTDGVCAFDRTGEMIQMNTAAAQLIGLFEANDADVSETKPSYEELFGELLPLEEALAIKPPDYFETSHTTADRSLDRSLKVIIAPFGENEREGGVMAVVHDITEQTRLENVRREFIANVSHELRTPLTNVKSYTETLLENDDIDRETQERFLDVIIRESDRMTRIVQDLLTLSRFDYGSDDLRIHRAQTAKLIERVYRAMYMDAVKHNHTMTMEFLGHLPDIYCDSDRIEQVLTNILSNAIKYTPEGGEIAIKAWTEEDNINIQIKDTGIGIPEKDLGRLFERFYRVDKARSREAGGSGLGLAIAKEIVERHGGSIALESKYGEGTTVTIVLPVRGEDANVAS